MKKFLKTAFNQNQWLWFHMFAGAFFSLLLLKFGLPEFQAFSIIVGCGVGWEILEYCLERYFFGFASYGGSSANFFADSSGDLVGEIAMSVIVILTFRL